MTKRMRVALAVLAAVLLAVGTFAVYTVMKARRASPVDPVHVPDTNPPLVRQPPTQPAEPQTATDFVIALQWVDKGMLQVYGMASSPDVHLAVVSGERVLASADAQVKVDRYSTFIEVPAGHGKDLRLVVSAVEPDGQRVMGQVALDRAIPTGVFFSTNFRVTAPVRVSAEEVLVEGRARAFEAVFVVEVRSQGKLLARKKVVADEFYFGQFREAIRVPGGIPSGAEVWLVQPSAKDGSLHAELATVSVIR